MPHDIMAGMESYYCSDRQTDRQTVVQYRRYIHTAQTGRESLSIRSCDATAFLFLNLYRPGSKRDKVLNVDIVSQLPGFFHALIHSRACVYAMLLCAFFLLTQIQHRVVEGGTS